jgi:SAM-dependent methyltransferase
VENRLPFADRTFDLVHTNQLIEHVRDTDGFVSEIRRVLKPGGMACISTNNLASWHNIASLVLGYQPFPMHVSDRLIIGNPLNPEHGSPHVDAGRVHVRLFTARALSELCAHHGIALLRMRTVGYYPLPPRVLGRVAARVDPRHGAFLIGLFRRAD